MSSVEGALVVLVVGLVLGVVLAVLAGPPTYVRARRVVSKDDAELRRLVRDGSLTDEQHDRLNWLLHLVGHAVSSGAKAGAMAHGHPDPELWRETYRAAAWEPVGKAYAELLQAVSGEPGASR